MQQISVPPIEPLALAQQPLTQVDRQRKHDMQEAWKAYRGQFPKSLKVEEGKPDDNVIANFMVSIVDKGASWLFGQPVKIETTGESSSPSSVIQEYVNGLWGDDDDATSLLFDAATNGGTCGQVFLKLIPAQGQMKYPRIVVMDPQLIRVVTAPDDVSLVLAYIIEYPGTGSTQKRQVITRIDPDASAGIVGEYDLNDTWTISNYFRMSDHAAWFLFGAVEVWPYPFPPIFSCKNLPNPNENWGTPDLTPDLIDQNKTLNFLLSNLARIVKFHGHPKTWIKGVGRNQVSMGVDEMVILDSPDASMGVITPMENFAGILSVIATIMSNIDQQSRVPAVALGRQETLPKLGNISGVALALMFQPLIEKTTQKRRLYGKMIREITRAALIMAGLIDVSDFEDYQIDLHWQPLLPADNLTAAQEAVILQSIGVSQSTIFAGLGLNADDEADKKQSEDARSLTNFSRGQGMPPPAVPLTPVESPVQPVAQPVGAPA